MMQDKNEFQKVVDVDKLIKEGNNKSLKLLPEFLVNQIKKILRQKELNIIHNKYNDKFGMDYIISLLKEFDIKIRIHNETEVKDADRCIFVANHPLGAIDSLAYLYCINKLKGEVVSPSNDLFTYVPNLLPLIIGVNVLGKSSKEQVVAMNNAFLSNVQIMIFPAGKVSRRIKGEIQDFEWYKSFISKAVQSKRYVVPAYISGINSKKFYRIANLRKLFRIKMPIEMMYLPQEMLKKRGETIDLVFGKPIPYYMFDDSKTPHQWAQHVREKVYKLKNYFYQNINSSSNNKKKIFTIQ